MGLLEMCGHREVVANFNTFQEIRSSNFHQMFLAVGLFQVTHNTITIFTHFTLQSWGSIVNYYVKVSCFPIKGDLSQKKSALTCNSMRPIVMMNSVSTSLLWIMISSFQGFRERFEFYHLWCDFSVPINDTVYINKRNISYFYAYASVNGLFFASELLFFPYIPMYSMGMQK